MRDCEGWQLRCSELMCVFLFIFPVITFILVGNMFQLIYYEIKRMCITGEIIKCIAFPFTPLSSDLTRLR